MEIRIALILVLFLSGCSNLPQSVKDWASNTDNNTLIWATTPYK